MDSILGPLGIRFAGLSAKPTERNELDRSSFPESLQLGIHVHFINAYVLTCAMRDEKLLDVLRDTNALNFVDSFWLRKILKLKYGSSAPSQVRGPLLFATTITRRLSGDARHLVVSPTQRASEKIMLARANSSKRHLSFYSPPFSADTTFLARTIAEEVRGSKASIVWVGLGTPKQDFIAEQISQIEPCVSICIGAAVDFLSGEKKEAPVYLQRIGLEWLFRLITEPSRLWRRYLLDGWGFLVLAIQFLIAGK